MPRDKTELILNNQYLAQFVVDEVFSRLRPDEKAMYYDDCLGVALENLCIAAETYDDEKSSFPHWAFICIKRALWKYILKEQLHGLTGIKNIGDLEGSIINASNPDKIVSDQLFRPVVEDPVQTVMKKELCDKIKSVASEVEYQIAELLAEGYDYETIGKILYRDPVAIRRRMADLRKKVTDIA